MEFGDLSDNPFAIELSKPKTSRRKSVGSAVKFLLLVAVCLAATLVIGNQSRRWLVHRLTHDFDSLSTTAKQARLIRIADLDALAIQPLVNTLADDDIDVARTAYDLLSQSQNSWTVLEQAEQQQRHASMVDALTSIAVYLPDDRTGWGTSLLQKTILMTVESRDEQSQELYRSATHAVEMLSLSDRSGPSILDPEPLDPLAPKRLAVRTRPLPISLSALESASSRTVGTTPGSAVPNVDGRAAAARPHLARLARSPAIRIPRIKRLPRIKRRHSNRRSTVRLRCDCSQSIPMSRWFCAVEQPHVEQPRETSYQDNQRQQPPGDIQSVTHLVDSPMETFDDKSVMHWLGSPHQALRDKARLELIDRGFDDTELNIATQLASGDVQTRMTLIDAIARSDSIDPRPWLLMMLGDTSRDVKLRAVSVLATMKDADVDGRLRMHLVEERDPTVAFRIRRVLDLR